MRRPLALPLSVLVTLALVLVVASFKLGQPSALGAQKRVEVSAKRTAHSKTFLNSDGSYTTEIDLPQVNYEDSQGEMRPVNATLVKDANGFRATENSLVADFNNVAGRLLTLSKKDESDIGVSLALIGAESETMTPTAEAPDEIKYKDFKQAVDLDYKVLGGRVKEEIVLNQPPADNAFVFELTLKGLTPAVLDDGSIALRNDRGKTSIMIEKPFMTDANEGKSLGTPDRYSSQDVQMAIEKKEGSTLYANRHPRQGLAGRPRPGLSRDNRSHLRSP